MPQVNRIATPATPLEMSESFTRVWTRSEPLTNNVMWLLLALWDLETASGKSMWNNNAGNIIRTPQWSGDWYLANDSGNMREFRAYPTRDAGAAGLVGLLTGNTREQWRKGLLSGNPEIFVRALNGQYGGPQYFEADFEKYLAGFLSRYSRYAGTAYTGPDYDASTAQTPTPLPPQEPMWYLIASAALAGALVAWRKHQR